MVEPYKRYVFSIYFIVQTMTTVGYGDIIPTNTTERVFFITLMAFGVFVFAMVVGMLATILQSATEAQVEKIKMQS